VLVGWYEASTHIGALALWPAILLISFVIMPACFLLVWFAIPLWSFRWTWAIGAVLVGLALLFSALHYPIGSNFCKLLALSVFGWWFLTYFEALSWVVIVALLIPWVDALSVWRGPTKSLTGKGHEHIFGALSVAFVVPGGGAARLGLPDVLFFAVFLGAAMRFRLRPGWTFLAMLVGLGITMMLAIGLMGPDSGLPALPGISLGFLLPNIDLLWTRLRRTRLLSETESVRR
jgi:hypothetical protein